MIITESMVGFVLLIVDAMFAAFWRIWGLIREAAARANRRKRT